MVNFKVLHFQQPSYLASLVPRFWSASQPTPTLRVHICHTTGGLKTTSLDVWQIITTWFFPRHLCWNRARILSLLSLLIWLIYLSCKVLFHQNSSWHKSHLFWRSLGSKSDPSKFRPISNLNTIGKLLERLASARLLPHLSISPSFSPLQSAYRKFHSTEIALHKLTNDIMDTIDSGKDTFLLLSICRLLLTLWTTPPFFIGLNIHSVCQEMSTPGFTHTQQIVHLLLRLTHHLPLVIPHSLASCGVQFSTLSFLF